MDIKYNDNITLIEKLPEGYAKAIEYLKKRPLKENEYFAIMVEDPKGRQNFLRDIDTRVFFNESLGQLGLEHTTPNKIYISKELRHRHNLSRGSTFIVKVKDIKKCCVLEGDY